MSTRTSHDRSSSNPGKVANRAADEVGYGRPPRAHQFKPGQSGNPRGRRKGTRNETTILRDLLNRRIDVREGASTRKITIFEAILLRFTEDALKGNTKSAAFLFDRYAGSQEGESQPDHEISKDDREVLDDFIRRFEAQFSVKRETS
jgi:hypothetical protein